IRQTAEHLEAKIKYHLLAITGTLNQYEGVAVRSRVKECESALDALRRREEGATFDPDRLYSLTKLKDLAGVRVLAFPRSRLEEIDEALRLVFPAEFWTANPVLGENSERLAFKYSGYCPTSTKVLSEYQVVSMLTGLFWEIEHAAIYKPSPELRGLTRSPSMQARSRDVLNALGGFEDEFERLLKRLT
ncbi:MAG: hypothetical protein ACRD5Z_07595, partial [Bryobacteraceae bacterium]